MVNLQVEGQLKTSRLWFVLFVIWNPDAVYTEEHENVPTLFTRVQSGSHLSFNANNVSSRCFFLQICKIYSNITSETVTVLQDVWGSPGHCHWLATGRDVMTSERDCSWLAERSHVFVLPRGETRGRCDVVEGFWWRSSKLNISDLLCIYLFI